MKKIELTNGRFALVDDEDYEELNRYRWYFSVYDGYARSKNILMHRLINKTPHGMITDHINHDKLDNRKENLRTCTKSTNGMNRGKNKNNTSGFKGVSFCGDSKRKKCWMARIVLNRKEIKLGRFETPIEASKAYQIAANKYHKEFASI